VTTSGEPPSGAGGVNEPDWIDQILSRATDQTAARRDPIVPEPTPVVPQVEKVVPQPDNLGEIRWVDTTEVVPASTPVAGTKPVLTAPDPQVDKQVVPASASILNPQPTELVPEAVGRSAWDADLATVGETDPDGWDKLSWQDLDDKRADYEQQQIEQGSFGRLLREWGPVLFGAVFIALFTRLVLVQAYHIPSESMVPTLEAGDRVVVNRLSYQFGEIERGQVVVFSKPQGTEGENDLIKRVIGLPGETIRFVDNKVYINGLRVEEPYLLQEESTRPRLQIPGCAQAQQASDLCQIPAGHVFVMGDNRLGSSDSRVFGPVSTESVVGRAFMRVWPLNHFGQL